MPLVDAYVQGYGKLTELFSKIRDGQAPEQFTYQLLKDWGFSSSNDRQFIPLLKALGFLSPDGKPTSRYHEYRDHSRSSVVMGEALHEAYGDLFLIKSSLTKADRDVIQSKFKSYHNGTDRTSQLMTNTFLALLGLADLSKRSKLLPHPSTSREEEHTKGSPSLTGQQPTGPRVTEFHYDIQIHLPATKDIEVYNAIFKSLKEHLYET